MLSMPRKAISLYAEDLEDESLVFHSRRKEVNCLNASARFVFEHCDGETPLVQVAAELESKFDLQGGEELVKLALDRLSRQGLVEGWQRSGVTRRGFLQRFAASAAYLPLVASTLAPTPAYALSGDCSTVGDAGCTALLATSSNVRGGRRFSGCAESCKPTADGETCAQLCATIYCADPTNPLGNCTTDDTFNPNSVAGGLCRTLFSSGHINFSCSDGRAAAVATFEQQLILQCASGLDAGSFNCPTVDVTCPATGTTVTRRMFEYVCCDCSL